MYNITLIFFMTIGWLQMHLTAVVIVLALLVALYGMLFLTGRGLFNGKAFVQGLGLAALLWIIIAILLPSLTGSSWENVTYSTDFIMLALMSAGFAGLGFLLIYPVLVMMQKKA